MAINQQQYPLIHDYVSLPEILQITVNAGLLRNYAGELRSSTQVYREQKFTQHIAPGHSD